MTDPDLKALADAHTDTETWGTCDKCGGVMPCDDGAALRHAADRIAELEAVLESCPRPRLNNFDMVEWWDIRREALKDD